MTDVTPMKLSCVEFQEKLPDMFSDTVHGRSPILREHLSTCANCSALVRDLEYIAEQARLLLLPTEEPSDNVWNKIQSKLQQPETDEVGKVK